MYNHVVNCGRKALLISFISLFLLFPLTQISHAADDGDWWLQRQIQLQQNREDYARRVYGSARHTYDTVDPVTSKTKTITKIAIVEDVPSKQKLGKVLLERAKKYKSGIAGVIGGAAITGIIEAVGWVMEDGTWVKYKQQPNDGLEYTLSGYAFWESTKELACTQHAEYYLYNGTGLSNTLYISSVANNLNCEITFLRNKTNPFSEDKITRSMYSRPATNTPQPQRIIITDQDVGGIVSGDYSDPVDSTKNITDKQFRPVVAEAYKHDPSGIGNDLANEMDDRLKNAPPTSDGKPAPIGDTRFSTPPQDDQITNDRSWNDDGSTATGDTTPTTDPTTGQPTGGQSISLQFPIFCEWAHTMCKWYDDWKASDTVYKDHMTKTEEHQTQEKGFWQSVNDWFDWTRENHDLEDDEPEQVNELPLPELQTNAFSATSGCPEPIPIQIKIGVEGTAYISYEPICQFASKWSFIAPLIGFLSGAMIIVGVGRKGEDSEI